MVLDGILYKLLILFLKIYFIWVLLDGFRMLLGCHRFRQVIKKNLHSCRFFSFVTFESLLSKVICLRLQKYYAEKIPAMNAGIFRISSVAWLSSTHLG